MIAKYIKCGLIGVIAFIGVFIPITGISQNHSVARLWNEALLHAIRNDYARPTVHARNLFHSSIAMYDSWAVYNDQKTYLLGNNVANYKSIFDGFTPNTNPEKAVDITISYAAYRLLNYRFSNSPGVTESRQHFNELMAQLGYDTSITTTDYSNGDPAALGNFIAETLINFGAFDGAREATDYDNAHYSPLNEPLVPELPGNPSMIDPNRWQPLMLDIFIDQSGNIIDGNTPEFLSPEWGDVTTFALSSDQSELLNRNGEDFRVYLNPGEPPHLTSDGTGTSELYKWNFSLVSIWSSHLDPSDGTMIDISPKSIGNINFENIPNSFNEYPNFYLSTGGGDIGTGRDINPKTGEPYQEQMVLRGDYTRVLAEFWADGPDSETPPGHWFTILNYVNDHPSLVKKVSGEGEILNNLEWDVKTYFALGGAMHDAAVAAWSVKGWHDYVRPISAIRHMAEKGQSSDPSLPNYHIEGIPLEANYVELVEIGDELAGTANENVGKIKLYAWRGPEYITTSPAGVGWILAENWWPYQRPTFITPPFAGYVSGHSTFSRAAAEVLTAITGDEYFPGGMAEFVAEKDNFLVFEKGPSETITLQWATYRDASDQCSLSRIWGGIHPPADDLPGRKMGEVIGKQAYQKAISYFRENEITGLDKSLDKLKVFPNPLETHQVLRVIGTKLIPTAKVYDLSGRIIPSSYNLDSNSGNIIITFPKQLKPGMYILRAEENTVKFQVN